MFEKSSERFRDLGDRNMLKLLLGLLIRNGPVAKIDETAYIPTYIALLVNEGW